MIELEIYKLNKNGLPMKNEGITEISNEGIENNGTSGIIIDILRDGQAGRQMIVDIVRLPDAQFSADHTGGCAPLTVQFSGTDSLYADAYQYAFGDGVTAGEQNASHEYTESGLYTVALTAHSNLALADDTLSRYQYIEVLTPPDAQFHGTPTSGQATLPVSFYSDCTGDVSSYLWAFGDGYTSASQNPTHSYTAAGTYGVALTAGNKYCSDYLTKPNYISVRPAGQWVSKLGSTYWDLHTGYFWDGSSWQYVGEVSSLSVKGPWANNYRPSKVRLTFSGSNPFVDMWTYQRNLLAHITTNTEITIDWSLNRDINTLAYAFDTTITNIEFYEVA